VSGKDGTRNAGGIDRRELLSALARWTVPTVVTLSLATRAVQAASCPPCTKRQPSGACRACTMNQMLNCQCEPCLGPPYCSSAITPQPGWAPPALSQQSPGSTGFGGARGPGENVLDALRRRRALAQQEDPFASPFSRRRYGVPTDSIFRSTPRNPYGRDARSPAASGLYDRLRRPEDRR
jgi:hypothetical protein